MELRSNNRILVIDDTIEMHILLKSLFEGEGYHLDFASNGQVAIDFLRSCSELPSLILLDLMMPVMDGYQFREAQLRDSRIAGIPVALMTADGHVEEKKSRVGAKEYLKKPLNINELLDVAERYCARIVEGSPEHPAHLSSY